MVNTSHLRSALLFGVAGAAIMAALPGVAAAQAAPSGPAIPEVVVTAEKRAVNIQNVPVAVTAFTAKERALEGINTVQDLTNFTPGLVYSSQLDRPVMRGLARTTNTYTADSSVGVYDNDLFTNSTFLVGRDDMIVDQIEVLAGPQNTLYGRNAVGGIINTQSKRPSEIFGGEFREDFGNYGMTKTEGTITGPLSFINPNLSFRFSGYYDSQDKGWIHNLTGKDLTGAHHDPYVELQLQYKTDQDTIWLQMYNLTFNSDRGGPGAALQVPETGPYNTALTGNGTNGLFFNPNAAYNPANIVAGSATGLQPGGINPSNVNIRTTALNQVTNINLDAAWDFNFHWTHHFDGFDVKYVGGYSQYHYASFLENYLNGDSSVTGYSIPLYPTSIVPIGSGNYCALVNLKGGACGPLALNFQQDFQFISYTRWFSHELNFSSTTNGPISWIAGLYYYNEADNQTSLESDPYQSQLNGATWNVIPVTGATALIPTLLTGGTPTKAIYNPSQRGDFLFLDYQDRIQTGAAFVQASYKISPTLKATVGLRYTYDKKNAEEESRYIQLANATFAHLLGQFTPGLDITALETSSTPAKGVVSATSFPTTGKYAGDAVRNLSDHSDAVTGTAALEWTPDRDTLAYARYNRGYKAFALNAGYVGPNPEAAPEFVNDYEVGLKKTLGRNLQVDIAGFYYDYSNDQVQLAFPSVTPGGVLNLNQFVNLPKAVSDGIEVTALWSPISHLNLSLTYGLDHTTILSGCAPFTTAQTTVGGGCFIDPADPYALAKGAKPAGPSTSGDVFQSVKGGELPQAPENKVAFNANYTMYFDPGNLTLSGTYTWRDKSYSSIFTRSQYDIAPSWSQVDLRATWSGNHDHYEIVAYVKNLFDTQGYDAAAGGSYAGTAAGVTYNPAYDLAPPRLYGAEIHYKF